jgi:hypothetical protein
VKLLLVAAAALALSAQDIKHVPLAPLNGSGRGTATARSIEHGAEYPAVIHLKGDVEIRTPQCIPTGKGTEINCYGETIVRADEADYHEDTGEIEARGHVRVTPLRTAPKP